MRSKVVAVVTGVLVVVVTATTAFAGHQTSVASYTGCLVPKDGVIIKVKEGDEPKSTCTGGQTQVHLSGGDITKISVGGGLSLPNGGDNGEVTIALDQTFSLPQNCNEDNVPRWSRDDSNPRWICGSFRAGTGLDLNSAGDTFSIRQAYRVKNTPDCPGGKFATGFDDTSGEIECESPASSLTPYQARQANFVSGDGIADDGADHTYVTLAVPAGTYLVQAKGVLTQGDDDVGFRPKDAFGCKLANLPQEQSAFFGLDNEAGEYGFALAGVVTTSGEPLKLDCFATNDLDLISIAYGTLVAIKIA